MAKRVSEDTQVVWIAPESLVEERIQDALKRGVGAERVGEITKLAMRGEFRELKGHKTVGFESVPEYGRRVVWVDDAPNDSEDGKGHFEVYSGDDADYQPTVKA